MALDLHVCYHLPHTETGVVICTDIRATLPTKRSPRPPNHEPCIILTSSYNKNVFNMGLGVLEPSTESHVAGTVILRDEFAREHLHTSRLKHGTGKSANIVLNPQPSDDPNDPLGWSSWEKHLILGILAYGCIVTACVTVRLH